MSTSTFKVMSQQAQLAPAGQPPGPPGHAHPHPPQMQRPPQALPQPDPIMQARIEADFKPVDLTVGGPSAAFAFCNSHKLEKCKECNVDFMALNRISKILFTNPALRCPPPPNVVQQKLSQAVTNMKDEGNVCLLAPFVSRIFFLTFAHRTCTNSARAKKHSQGIIRQQA